MKYFIPDWEDRVDPGFDFATDQFTPDRDIRVNDVYAHQIYEEQPPYDGILVSRGVIAKIQLKQKLIEEIGIHKYLKLRDDFPVMGDCGAFSYVNESKPKYDTDDVIAYYANIGVDLGVSVDHLIVKSIYVEEEGTRRKVEMSQAERERRKKLTLDNAQDFIDRYNPRKHKFIPIGAAQGWNPFSYADSVKHLLPMGYKYVALGGLARSSSKEIISVLKEVYKVIQEFEERHGERIDLHIFGVAKLNLVPQFQKCSVASIDSASFLRKAWLKSGRNYRGYDGNWYTAIRVPPSTDPRMRRNIEKKRISMEGVKREEQLCLKALQAYDQGQGDLAELLDMIVKYDELLLRDGTDGKNLREKYQMTLEEKPWKKCPCKICRDLGIHVMIFRGTNRNKRRGFHNTWVFYRELQRKLKEAES